MSLIMGDIITLLSITPVGQTPTGESSYAVICAVVIYFQAYSTFPTGWVRATVNGT
jgi:hypothetical protein